MKPQMNAEKEEQKCQISKLKFQMNVKFQSSKPETATLHFFFFELHLRLGF